MSLDQIVWKKTLTKEEQIRRGNYITSNKVDGGRNLQNKTDIDLRKIDREQIRPAKVTREMSKLIQETRNGLGLDQAKLAQMCGLSKDIIRDYENGKAVVHQMHLSKINRALKLNMKKPKAEKILME